MKICIIHDSLGKFGGAENITVWYSSELIKRGHDITILTSEINKSFWSDEYTSNLKVLLSKSVRFNRNPLLYEVLGYKVSQLVKQFDLIIVNIWLNASIFLSYRKKKAPWVWFCQEPPRYLHYREIDKELIDFWGRRRILQGQSTLNDILNHTIRNAIPFLKKLDIRYVQKVFSKIVANSNYTARNVEIVYDRKAIPCHPGVKKTLFKKEYENKKNEEDYDFLILHVGRITPAKNLSRLIRAISMVKTNKKFRLLIAGMGESLAHLKQLVQILKLKDKVQFLGFVPQEILKDYFNSADLIVSLPINEPFGLVPIEGMACGKLVLTSNIGGPSETVIDKKTGFLCNPFDVREIKSKIEYIINNHDKLKNIGVNARDHYSKHFTLEHGINRFEKIVLEPFYNR
ncbi:MAG: glycosyltransferase family 4 protein [Promethearchaeota archaeon]